MSSDAKKYGFFLLIFISFFVSSCATMTTTAWRPTDEIRNPTTSERSVGTQFQEHRRPSATNPNLEVTVLRQVTEEERFERRYVRKQGLKAGARLLLWAGGAAAAYYGYQQQKEGLVVLGQTLIGAGATVPLGAEILTNREVGEEWRGETKTRRPRAVPARNMPVVVSVGFKSRTVYSSASGIISLDIMDFLDLADPGRPLDLRVALEEDPTQSTTMRVPPSVVSALLRRLRTPPEIQIYEPPITRGMVVRKKQIRVKGRATDDDGIYEVLVNGQEATLNETGNFWSQVWLKMGENRIVVEATDIHKNTARESFTIIRKGEVGPSITESEFGSYHALLIAVEDYADRSINDLDFPVDDAERLKKVLQTNYTFDQNNIHFLKNPDRQTILKKFGELRDRLEKEDNLLIFFAGHGYWDEELKQGYWLQSDARQDAQYDWISNSTIKDMIRGIRTQHALLISDACFSGGIFKTRDVFLRPDISFQKVYEMPSRKAITSGNLKTVPDKSVFVEYLVKRLEQNRERYLYSEKLFINMRDAVINNSPNNQTPLFGVVNGAGDEGGDFIFVRRQQDYK